MEIKEQNKVLENNKKNMLVSASAGSGKTYVMIKYISKLICEDKIPVKNLLVLTFTKAAATEMKERLQKRLKEQGDDPFVVEQIDDIAVANISTIHSFCEKCIKKYANLLGLNENFAVADDNMSQKLKSSAFDKALKKFNQDFQEDYFKLMECYKNDKSKLREIMFEIENLVNAVSDKEAFFENNMQNSETNFNNAINYLFERVKFEIKDNLAQVEAMHVDEFYSVLKTSLSPILDSKDLFEVSKLIEDFSFPYLPKRKDFGDEIVDHLNSVKGCLTKTFAKIKDLNLHDENNVDFQKYGTLEKLLLKLYFVYESQENSLKHTQNLLDFNDLEKYMKILSEKENLFSDLKYVFVDEYQDTNKVQERIIKNVAKNCNFVAVGDVKQGIYGFRLASCEIFLKDLEEFEMNDDSDVNYLQSNFRTSQKILDFVNDIFKVCMTKELCGVDYENGSMLKGLTEFKAEACKPVNIDLISESERRDYILPTVYSVKEDNVVEDQDNLKQLLAIKNRINEVMSSEIYDNGTFRRCRYSDIAILSRKRNSLFNQLEVFLQESGIPVISNSRNNLMDEVEVKILLNFLKVSMNIDDEIALMSVLMSGLFKFKLEEIIEEKIESAKSLCELVIKNQSGKFSYFANSLSQFKKNALIFGISKALRTLLDEASYFAYINMKADGYKINTFVDKFFTEIEKSGFDFDLPGLINYFESVDIAVASQPSAVLDSVLLTTIHNSKGLEYPIVFLIGCDQSLKKSRPKIDVEINEDFGFAVKFYDQEKNNEIISVRMRAIKDKEAEKDFVEELMIFYVALTRAKNRLYLFGNFSDSIFEKYSVRDCDCYFDFIFFALKEAKQILLDQDSYESESLSIRHIEEIEEESFGEKQNLEKSEFTLEDVKQIENYLNFKYAIDDKLNFKLKESVTSLSHKNQEDNLEKFSNENFNFGGSNTEIGNAYHLALKTLDFEKISNFDDLNEEILKNKAIFSEISENLDLNLLLKNILTLKNFCINGKVFKEKDFILKERICDLVENVSVEDRILVQGIIDLFIIKENKIILIDYKYSNSTNDNYLINKYKNQLKLYKIALENGYKLPVKEAHLLSLKNNKLIKVDF